MNPILALVIGLLTGAIAAWLIAQAMAKAAVAGAAGKLEAREQEVKDLRTRIEQMNQRIDQLNAEARAEASKAASAEARAQAAEKLEKEAEILRKQNAELQKELARVSETLAKERQAAEEKLAIINEATTRLSDTFQALSSQALKSNNEQFLELAHQVLATFHERAKGDLTEREKAIQALVQPLRETLEKYEKQVRELEAARQGAYSGLEQQVKALLETGQSLRQETTKLVTALSAPRVRGRWGEITLRRVVELAGMSEHCDFVEQESVDSPAGRLRPDMIINMPSGRKIIIDAKTVLDAYLAAVEATTDDERQLRLAEHARQVKTRVNDLCKKEYWDQWTEAPEFVVLFLPGEQFLGAALQEDPRLLEDAFEKRVIIATPTTLIALLKAVAYGWRQEVLTQNAQQISQLGKELYERLLRLTKHLEKLGKSLDASVEAFNLAVGSFESRVLVSARKFKELGATGKEEIAELPRIEKTARQLAPPANGDDTEPENSPAD